MIDQVADQAAQGGSGGLLGSLVGFRTKFHVISDANIDGVLVDIGFSETTSVHESSIGLELLLEQTVSAFPCFNAHATQLVLEGFPAEHSLFENTFKRLISFQFLLPRVLLIILHVMVQVYSNARAVHRAPDVIKSLIDILFEDVLIKS